MGRRVYLLISSARNVSGAAYDNHKQSCCRYSRPTSLPFLLRMHFSSEIEGAERMLTRMALAVIACCGCGYLRLHLSYLHIARGVTLASVLHPADSYMNYHVNFLHFYIEEEMEIYEKVFEKWEECDEKFAKLGSALTYHEFEQARTLALHLPRICIYRGEAGGREGEANRICRALEARACAVCWRRLLLLLL